MGTLLTRHERIEVLRIASRLTSLRDNPDNVMRHATVLTAWLDEAGNDDDRQNRLAALDRADTNRQDRRSPDGSLVAPQDDPEILITEAETYYDYLKGA